MNNNNMERFNEELRDREKVTRNLKNPNTPILVGLQIYHNRVRPHMALGENASRESGNTNRGRGQVVDNYPERES